MAEQETFQQAPVKLYRTADRVMVAAPFPGLEPQDIDVEVTSDQRVVLHGRARGTLSGQQEVLADEWQAGPYHRELILPTAVDGEHANVTYGNGILVVVLPVLATGQMPRAARLSLTALSATRGEHAGNAGRPPQPEEPATHEAMRHPGVSESTAPAE